MIPSLSGGAGGISSSDTDNSAQTSGNVSGNSNDRTTKQFFNINGGGSAALDLNSIINRSSAGFYESIKGEQSLDAKLKGAENNTFKYVALGAGVLVALLVVVAMKKGK